MDLKAKAGAWQEEFGVGGQGDTTGATGNKTGLIVSSRSSSPSSAQPFTRDGGATRTCGAVRRCGFGAPAGALSGSTGSTISLDRKSNWSTLDRGVPVRSSPPPTAAAAASAAPVKGGDGGRAGVAASRGGSCAACCTSGAAKGEAMRLRMSPSASTHTATTCGS